MKPRRILVSSGTFSSSSPARAGLPDREQRGAEQHSRPRRAKAVRRLNLAASLVRRRLLIRCLHPLNSKGIPRFQRLTIAPGSGRFFGALPNQGFIQQANDPGNDGYIG